MFYLSHLRPSNPQVLQIKIELETIRFQAPTFSTKPEEIAKNSFWSNYYNHYNLYRLPFGSFPDSISALSSLLVSFFSDSPLTS